MVGIILWFIIIATIVVAASKKNKQPGKTDSGGRPASERRQGTGGRPAATRRDMRPIRTGGEPVVFQKIDWAEFEKKKQAAAAGKTASQDVQKMQRGTQAQRAQPRAAQAQSAQQRAAQPRGEQAQAAQQRAARAQTAPQSVETQTTPRAVQAASAMASSAMRTATPMAGKMQTVPSSTGALHPSVMTSQSVSPAQAQESTAAERLKSLSEKQKLIIYSEILKPKFDE